MMTVPDNLKFIVSNYRMNLIEVRKSENLLFENEDIDIVFKMVRSIYNDDYNGFYKAYKDQSVSVEVGLTVGSIVNSQAILNQALSMEKEGGNINMCEALQRWLDEEVKKGRIEGKAEGKIQMLKELVKDGTLSVVKAAAKAEMTVEQFEKELDKFTKLSGDSGK